MAEENEVSGNTLRDTIEQAFDEHVDAPEPVSQPAPGGEVKTPEGAAAASEAKDDRPRGPDGKFIEKPKEDKPAPVAAVPAQVVQTAAVQSHGLARPSSWKKDHEEKWSKLDADLAKYILERESQYANGVSTYKREFDNLKPLGDVVTANAQLFQQYGIDPAKQFAKYIEIHKGLALGSPEQKLSMLMRLSQDYQIPLQSLFTRGQDGQVYFNPQVQPYQPPQQPAQQPDVRKEVQDILMQERAQQALDQFEREATEKYPHYEQLKPTMAQLLEAGVANDYPSAYDKALRMNDDLWKSTQEEKRKAEEADRLKKTQEAAALARRNAVSTRSATPAQKAPSGDKKGLRAQLEDAFDEHVGAARV